MEFTLASPARHNMRALTCRPATTSRASFNARRTTRGVTVRAARGGAQESNEQNVAHKVMISAISAFAAVSMALTGPQAVSAIGLPPRNAAPDLSLSKDDELLGNAFQKAGVPGNAPEAADQLKEKVPGLEPEGASGKVQNTSNDAASKAQNAAPDLSLSKDDELLGNAFQKAGVPGNAPKAADELKEKVPGLEPEGASGKAKSAGSDVASKAKNAAPDLSLSKDDELLGNAFQKAGVPGNAPKAADELKEKVPGLEPEGAAGKVQNASSDAASKAKNAAPDLSLGKDDELLGKAFEKAGVPGNAPKAADDLKKKIPGLKPEGAPQRAAEDAARNAKSAK